MGLKEILEDIDSKTGAEIEGIMQKADDEAGRIRSEAEAKAAEKEQSMAAKSKNDAEQIMVRETSKANIAAKMAYDVAANARVESAIGKIPGKIHEYTKGVKYRKLLDALAAKAAKELGRGCRVLVRKEDAQILPQEAGFNVEVADSQLSGGLIAVSADGKREIDYTLDALLNKLHDRLAQELLERVREKGD